MQQIKRILIGWEETSCLCLSFNKVSWVPTDLAELSHDWIKTNSECFFIHVKCIKNCMYN